MESGGTLGVKLGMWQAVSALEVCLGPGALGQNSRAGLLISFESYRHPKACVNNTKSKL